MGDVNWAFNADANTQQATQTVKGHLREITAELRNLKASNQKVKRSGKDVGDSLKKTGTEAKKAGGAFAGLSGQMQTLVKGYIGLQGIRGVKDLFVDAITTTRHFNQAIRDAGVLAGATGGEFKVLSDKARELGASTQFTATEAATAMQEFSRAGFAATETAAAMDGTLALAAATGGTLEGAANAMTASIKAWGLESQDASRLSDIFTAAINNSRFSQDELNEALKNAAPAGAAFGQSVEDTVTVTSMLVDLLGSGARAGMAFKMAMAQATVATKEKTKTLTKYGLTMEDINPETHAFSDVLQAVGDAGVSGADAMKIFGTEAGGAIANVAQHMADGTLSAEAFKGKLNEVGIAGKTAADRMDTLDGDLKKLSSAWESLQITMTGDKEGFFRNITKAFNGALQQADNLQKEAQRTGEIDWLGGLRVAKGFLAGPTEEVKKLNDELERTSELANKIGTQKAIESIAGQLSPEELALVNKAMGTHVKGAEDIPLVGLSKAKGKPKGRRGRRRRAAATVETGGPQEVSSIDVLISEARMARSAGDAYEEKAIAAADAAAKEVESETKLMNEAILAQQKRQQAYTDMVNQREKLRAEEVAAERQAIQDELDAQAKYVSDTMEALGIQAGSLLMQGIVEGARGEEGAFKRVLKGLLPILGQAAGALIGGGPAGAAIGGSLGGALAGLFHDGGVVGMSNIARAHQGAFVGQLRPGEVPAILQAGEVVGSRESVARNYGSPEAADRAINGRGGGMAAPTVINISAFDAAGIEHSLRWGAAGDAFRDAERSGRGWPGRR